MRDGDKMVFRARMKALTEQLGEDYLKKSDNEIAAAVLSLAEYQRADSVFAYSAMGRECATREIIEDALKKGKTVALPVVLGGGKMVFAEYRGALCEGAFGIGEPAKGAETLIPTDRDIVVVPALCCDREGFRLGRGGGYYDRYLVGCPAFTVCPCREKLMAERVPRDWNDLPVLAVITEDRTIRFREDGR